MFFLWLYRWSQYNEEGWVWTKWHGDAGNVFWPNEWKFSSSLTWWGRGRKWWWDLRSSGMFFIHLNSILLIVYSTFFWDLRTSSMCFIHSNSILLIVFPTLFSTSGPGVSECHYNSSYIFMFFFKLQQVWTQKCAVQKASVDVNISYY